MNYTKTIRSYCQNNEGTIIDVAQIAEDYFAMVPYKTLLKIFNRLRDEGILQPISKGVYLIKSENEISPDDAIIKWYASDNRGMIVGHELFKMMGLEKDFKGPVEIYTRMVAPKSQKVIGKYLLTGVNLFFEERIKKNISLLEIIEKGHTIKNRDLAELSRSIVELLPYYSNYTFEVIVREIDYSYSTASSLSNYLRATGLKDNSCLELYKKNTSQ